MKTPRVVVRDNTKYDAETYKSRLYHIYNDRDVKRDLNRRAPPEAPLPDLVMIGYSRSSGRGSGCRIWPSKRRRRPTTRWPRPGRATARRCAPSWRS